MSPMIAVLTLFAAFMAAEADARTEPAEITIHIRGEHKAVISALLAAVDEGTTRTGIAELDSLAATYGLMGIERKGRSSFYGYRFRLTFSPGADGAAIAGAYWTLAYIQSVEPDPPPGARAQKLVQPTPTLGNSLNNRAITRIPKKIGVGALTTVGVGIALLPGAGTAGDDGIGAGLAGITSLFLGYPLGVYLADRKESSFWLTFLGSGLGWWGGVKMLDSPNSSTLSEWAALITILGAPVLASELSRKDAVTGGPKRPKQSQDLRFSLGLVPEFQGGLSAVATLRF